ncbi:DEAD/DEAH box helicase family protein [Nocardioides sp. WL0053]|uniref:DEAD/DEAH box helicase family protein n=1 Tax=Nocardioides jiangsuensis TaxID=2866161 RepID=A0ABS7RGQ3_9ACTN|nr:DEAD/DEAH box helicase family protein [Nocardioides jiangsuensis]MBY9074220.1 DEAD/DEAH box helicase family protein [Nocardioides jiangsuensis]
MNKKVLSESDICDRFVTPAIKVAGWATHQWRREYGFTDGKIIVRGKLVARGKRKRADYLLFYKPNLPIALIEAKDNNHSVGAGVQQGISYAEQLQVPFVFSTNGDGFLFHDRTGTFPKIEQNLQLNEFPSPDVLWEHYCRWKGLETDQALVTSPNYSIDNGKQARYYQQLAINRTIEAIARGQQRLLLVMATGTGKTFTAFNIIWRLWKTQTAKRVLFLADRNILVDQTIVNDFKPFGSAMTKLDRSLVDKGNGKVDTSYEVYLSLYQAIVGGEDRETIYDKFPRDFFDLIVIDECHRGSAKEDSAWREILEYFDSAIQLGMTATPKETNYVSNISYFGKPVYSYSLKQGIEDGFLAPYKVIRVDLDVDLQGWRPEADQLDDIGALIEDRIYNQRDFDRTIVFPERDVAVAHHLTEFLQNTDPFNKTILFCENIDHAERMRQALINEPDNRELVQADSRYVMRITGDNDEGKAQLDNFIDPKQKYPVIATTSKLMSTGVDAQTCHVIAMDQRIQSLTEFKQMIGRGTRLRPDYGKYYFTIIDFRKATELFADPEWDGPAIQVMEVDDRGKVEVTTEVEHDTTPIDPTDIEEIYEGDPAVVDASAEDDEEGVRRYTVSGVPFKVIAERIQYYDKDGKLVTESLRDYTRRVVLEEFTSLDDFLNRWKAADRKEVIVDLLRERGVILEALENAFARDIDAFDLICAVAFDRPPLTRRERAEHVKNLDVFTKYGPQAREVLGVLLDMYADHGIDSIEKIDALKVAPFPELGTPVQIVKNFGGRAQYVGAVKELDEALYNVKNPAS